jgi:hypothetical protein
MILFCPERRHSIVASVGTHLVIKYSTNPRMCQVHRYVGRIMVYSIERGRHIVLIGRALGVFWYVVRIAALRLPDDWWPSCRFGQKCGAQTAKRGFAPSQQALDGTWSAQ